MNKILKQALFLVFFIFFYGWYIENEEICGALNDGLGMTLICASVLLGIGVFFPITIDIRDKLICIFWAGAMFVTGAVLHSVGITIAICAFAIYIVAVSIYFSVFIDPSTLNRLLVVGSLVFVLGIFLQCLAQKVPSLKAIDKPTEKPYVEDIYEYQVQWNLWVCKVNKKYQTMETFSLGGMTGTLEQARSISLEKINEWEASNTNFYVLDKDDLKTDHNIVFVKRLTPKTRKDY